MQLPTEALGKQGPPGLHPPLLGGPTWKLGVQMEARDQRKHLPKRAGRDVSVPVPGRRTNTPSLWAHQCAYECPPLSKTRPALPGKGIPPGFSGSPDPGALSEQRSWQHCPTRGTGGQGGPATLCVRTWRGTLPALAVPLAPAVSGCFSRKTHASLCSGRPLPSLFSSVLSEQGRLGKPASLKAALANTDLPGFWSPRPTCGRRRGVFPRKRDRDVDSASPRGSGRTQGSLGMLLGSHHPCRKMPFSKRRK